MGKYDVLDGGTPFTMDKTKNYVKNSDGTLSEIVDLSTLTTSQVGFIGHPSAIHKTLLLDRNISVLDEKKTDRTSGTGSIVISSGTTAQRDGTPQAGYFRFNTETSEFEGYNGTAWGGISGEKANMVFDTFAAGVGYTKNTTTQLTLSQDPGSENNMWVFFDSVFQPPDTFSQAAGVVTFDAAIPADKVDVLIGATAAIGVPGDGTVAGTSLSASLQKSSIQFMIDGGGSAITTGLKGFIRVPYDCTITAVNLVADQSGNIVVDIWKDTYANFPPTDADSITASAQPTLATAIKSEDTLLTGWSKTLSEGEYLAFNVDSAVTVTQVTLSLVVNRN